MLSRASFVNFKNLRQLDVDLSRFTVLVGPNGAGKTSIMQGIHLLTQLGLQRDQEPDGGASRFRQLFTGRWTPGRIVTSGQTSLQIALTEEGRGPVALTIDVNRQVGGSDQYTLNLTDVPQGRIVVANDKVIAGDLDTVFTAPSLKRLAAAVFLHLDATLMVRPSVVTDPEPRLQYDGDGLASVLAYLAGDHPDRKEAIEAGVAAIIPWFRRVLVKNTKVSRLTNRPFAVGREAVNVPVEEEIWGHRFAVESRDGAVVPGDMLSEGTVLVLGLLTMLHGPGAPRLVLLDDLDRALHLGAQVRLVRALRTILDTRPDLQIVASSHSPFLLQEIPAADVRVLGFIPGGVACRALTSHPDYPTWMSVLSTGEMWANLGEDWVGDGA